MQILVSGSTGLIGRALVPHLERAGHEVTRLVRPETTGPDGIEWDPASADIDRTRLEGFDAVVHLAGEPIAQRWTDRSKRRIRESRVQGTRLVATAVAELDDPPDVLVSASGVGYYGDRGDTWLTEGVAPGQLFISDVCRRWEAAAQVAAQNGVRVVNPRIGVVLSTDGGALPRLLPPFELGLGGHLGSGDQYMSWVTRRDAVRIIEHLIETEALHGAVNVCSPEPVPNRVFTEVLGDVLGRPTVLWVPGVGIRLLFGQMGEEVLLASTRVRPVELLQSGYEWADPELRLALQHVFEDD